MYTISNHMDCIETLSDKKKNHEISQNNLIPSSLESQVSSHSNQTAPSNPNQSTFAFQQSKPRSWVNQTNYSQPYRNGLAFKQRHRQNVNSYYVNSWNVFSPTTLVETLLCNSSQMRVLNKGERGGEKMFLCLRFRVWDQKEKGGDAFLKLHTMYVLTPKCFIRLFSPKILFFLPNFIRAILNERLW